MRSERASNAIHTAKQAVSASKIETTSRCNVDAMFGRLLCAAAILLAAPAHADDRAKVEAVVRTQLGGLDSEMTLGSTVTAHAHERFPTHNPTTYRGGGESPMFHRLVPKATFKTGSVSVVVLGDVAWFDATGGFTLSASWTKLRDVRVTRSNGIAQKQKDGSWLVSAVLFSIATDDKGLFDDARRSKAPYAVPKTTTFDGDKDLARAVGSWLTSHALGKAASTAPARLASGTAPNEHKTGAATASLTATWDKLTLVPDTVHAILVNPTLGYVTTDVAYAKGPVVAHLILGAVVVKEKDGWRWISINWSPAEWNPTGTLNDSGAEELDPDPDF